MAAQEAASRAVSTPDDVLASYLRQSATSAVQLRFDAGVGAVEVADGASAAEAACALLLTELSAMGGVMRPAAFAARAAEPALVAAEF